ncbi:MAG: zinc-dependent metalloprotease [Planctomycetota bacterium]
MMRLLFSVLFAAGFTLSAGTLTTAWAQQDLDVDQVNADDVQEAGGETERPIGLGALMGGKMRPSFSTNRKKTFPKFEDVIEGYEEVISTADKKPGLMRIWTRKKDNQMLAELPRNFSKKKFFFACTVASGEVFAGLQAGDRYVYWRRYDDRLALIEPNITMRSTGDKESKSSVERLFTDRVLLDIPIVTMRPRGGPVIDLDDLLVGKAGSFFGARTARGINRNLASIETAKAFPKNIEVSYEVPVAGGVLKSLHYSISEIPNKTGYKPRKADARVGYFTTSYQDLGQYDGETTWNRRINRWHLEKADPKLKLSPPKNPIVFYIEHTTPVRYRRFVREGLLYWNKAFENVGILNAIEVHYQDATTGAHMDKDPEDVRYNFIRWLNNDIGTAIGPSRVHPLTGQILDADIVLTDGWIRTFEFQFTELLPQIAMEGFGPETLAFLHENPSWDPRILMAQGHEQQMMRAARLRGPQAFGGHPLAAAGGQLMGDNEYDGLVGRTSQVNGLCMAALGKAFDLSLLSMSREIALAADKAKKDGKEEDEELLDGMPARFIGPLLADLVAHEVGHTLGLRHNFCASSLYTFAEINSDDVKGKKPFTASVMDYNPINIDMNDNTQGDYAMIDIGPYDMWAIEYGYTFSKKLDKILARCTEPALQYATDEDTSGPDPRARRYDFAKEPLDFAKSQINLANYHRERIIEHFVKEGDSWAKARRGYDLTLSTQMRAVSMMANWVGGSFVHRAKKGDGDRPPIEPVSAKRQRDAIAFVIQHSFYDEAFGITPDLMKHMSVDKWFDGGGFLSAMRDATYPLHDRVMGIQASALTMLMNPTTLGRVYDNELRVEGSEDCLTLPEVLNLVTDSVWEELTMTSAGGNYTVRSPMISNLRRNLQRTHLDRLIDLALRNKGRTAAYKSIASLSSLHLRKLEQMISDTLNAHESVDDYSNAHLTDCQTRIKKALEARFIVQ